jgi:hypothetical protein
VCPPLQSVALTSFFDNLEVSAANWTFPALSGSARWSRDNHFAYSGVYALLGNDFPAGTSDSVAAMNASYPVTTTSYLHFAHAFGFEGPSGDGGQVEYSLDNGTSWTNATALFDTNGYNGTITSGPLSGQPGFISDSHGYISSRLALAPLAGQNVRFRFRMSTGVAGIDQGWWVDDVNLYTCTATPSLILPIIGRNWGSALSSAAGSPPVEPGPWHTIMQEGFEGAWPGAGWLVTDPDFEEYFWARRDCRAASGSFSAWAMGGGSIGSGLGCSSNYINEANSWAVFGPFSLADATDAEFSAKLWLNSEAVFDYACLMASTNGNNFNGTCYHGSSGGAFVPETLDMASYAGQGNVWVAMLFQADASVNMPEGAYFDDLLLRKCVGAGACPAAQTIAAEAAGLTASPHTADLSAGR